MLQNYPYKIIGILLLLWLVTIFNGCITTYDTISNRDFSNQYSPGDQYLHTEYYLFTPNIDESRLYFRFFPKELAYTHDNKDSIPVARASLFFRITQSVNSIEIVDSLTTKFPFFGHPRAQFTGFVPIHFPGEGHYFIEIFLTDLISEKSVSTVLETDIGADVNTNFFMPLSLHGSPIFKSFVNVNDSFRMRCDICADSLVTVRFFEPEMHLPTPPDIPDESPLPQPQLDTIYKVKQLDTLVFSSTSEGIWLFSNSIDSGGKIILNTGLHFPFVKTPEALLDPLGYILTTKEMEQFRQLENPKVAVDSFWLMNVEELDEARDLIRIYYNRVQLANYFFSDYRQGWLTDMGMIYLVCGSPTLVKKTGEGETWIYGQGKKGDVEFFFYKEKHPTFGTVYRLHRSDSLSRIWFSAVNSWRDGRVFNISP